MDDLLAGLYQQASSPRPAGGSSAMQTLTMLAQLGALGQNGPTLRGQQAQSPGGAAAPSGDWLGLLDPTTRARASQYSDELARATRDAGLAPWAERLFGAGIVPHESSWIPTAVNHSSGAAGLGQLMPFNVPDRSKVFDPYWNLRWSESLFGDYLSRERGIPGGQNIKLALADYAAGPGNQSAGLPYAAAILQMLGGHYR